MKWSNRFFQNNKETFQFEASKEMDEDIIKQLNMSQEITIQSVLREFSGLSKEAFSLSEDYWKPVKFSKGEFYNNHKSICKYLGFILVRYISFLHN